ncbi:MAG: AAA family ATPase, partial [Candidatus Eremiobacterota bacterium]
REDPDVKIEIHLTESSGQSPLWKYALGIKQERGYRKPCLVYEKVWKENKLLLDRPDENDKKDKIRLTQTHLEQINANQSFREIAKFFDSILYLHLVPQLIRHPDAFLGPGIPGDPFGRSFLERVAKTSERTQKSRLKKIEDALRIAVPQLKKLSLIKDEAGIPHLEAIYEHWRPKAGKQREDQFSDGTLRLIGFLWSLLEGDSLLLLEEPELSLNAEIVNKIPSLISKLQKKRKRQIIMSTHSADLLSDRGIGGEEILLLIPGSDGTEVQVSSSNKEIRYLLEGGLSVGEAVIPHVTPKNINDMRQLRLF